MMRLVGEFNRTLDASSDSDDQEAFLLNPMPEVTQQSEWPHEVDMILSAMEVAGSKARDRRAKRRNDYRGRAELRLFSQPPLSPPTPIFTRDLDAKGIGFITQERLPLGYGGTVELRLPTGQLIKAACTIYRCRETIHGWFEGALHFTRDQRV